MIMGGKLLIVFVILMTVVFSALPPMPKCKTSDASCMKKAAQMVVPVLAAGVSELGTETLDTMQVDSIKVNLSGLKMVVTRVNITGLKEASIEKISVDMAKKLIELTYYADITMKGQYKASGRLLILPISGDGDVVIKLKRIEVRMTIPFKVVSNKNGKEVIDLKNYEYQYDVKDNAYFHLTNLFNGNKILGDTMLSFMNENWKVLSVEFGKPMLDKPINKIFNAMKIFLQKFSVQEILEY